MVLQSTVFNLGVVLFVIFCHAQAWEDRGFTFFKRNPALLNSELASEKSVLEKATDQEIAAMKTAMKDCLTKHGPAFLANVNMMYQGAYKEAHPGFKGRSFGLKKRSLFENLDKRDREADIKELLEMSKAAFEKEGDKSDQTFLNELNDMLKGTKKDAEDAVNRATQILRVCADSAKRALIEANRRRFSFDQEENDEE